MGAFVFDAMPTAIALSPDGARAAIGGGGNSYRIHILDAATAQPQLELTGVQAQDNSFLGGFATTPLAHDGPISSLAWTRDGRVLFSLSGEGAPRGNTLRRWDTATWRGEVVLDRAGARLRSLDVSRDGSRLLFSTGEQVEVWVAR